MSSGDFRAAIAMSPGLASSLVILVSWHRSPSHHSSLLPPPVIFLSCFSPRYSEVSFLELDKFLEDVRWVEGGAG